MTKLPVAALALLIAVPISYAATKKPGITVSLSSEDPRTQVGPRLSPRDARLAITTRDGSTMLLLTNDVVAVQLTDRALAAASTKEDAGFLEELVASAVKIGIRKAVAYPVACLRSVDVRDGALFLTNDKNQPVFTEIKVNGTEVLRDFTAADAARFANAFRTAKRARR